MNKMELGDESKSYVQYGCGFHAPKGWTNFDASPTLRFERIPVLGRFYTRNSRRFPANVQYGDIVQGLPIESQSCQGVYASHVLEHLCLEDMRSALKESLRILKPGAVFRLVVPDLENLAETYLRSGSPDAALVFLRNTCLGQERRDRGMAGLVKAWVGNSEHRWMWDQKSLEAELHAAGFTHTRRCAFGDHADPMFRLVEDPLRFDGAVAIEAARPEASAPREAFAMAGAAPHLSN